ncbi:MAG: phosphoglycerate dehydrogenase [Clostridia bacterium]|nr:phosphoglycerate dehydrogenase [Clostridia bacterium]
MYNIQTLNKISKTGLGQLNPDKYTCADEIANPDAIILRSFSMHEMELPKSLLAVARAGAGVNNIPIDRCSEQGVVVFNTPGANANAVKELVIASLLLASRKVAAGIEWVKGQKDAGDTLSKVVEKGKSSFAGPEIKGKKLGVIGLGAIGVMVCNSAYALGMEVIGYDPYISVDAAWGLSRAVKRATTLKEIYETCDYITLHIPLNNETRGMIGEETLKSTKDGVRILNFSRGELVDSAAIIDAINSGKVASYVTDFPTAEMLDVENITPMPHLGASTPESEENCAYMAANELKQYLEFGNIVNSVNFPNCSMPMETKFRVCIIHKNIPNMLGQVSTMFADAGINICHMINKSKGDNAYTLVDVDQPCDSIVEKINAIEGILSTRVIR